MREHIIDIGYELFGRDGVRGIGVNEIIDTAQIAKATFYRHFASKNDLVLAVVDHHARSWKGQVLTPAEDRASSPEERLLAVFESLDVVGTDVVTTFSFIRVLLDVGLNDPAGAAAAAHLQTVRDWARDSAEEAGLRDPEELAHSWQIILKGALIAAIEGDTNAAHRGRAMAALLLDAHR